MKAPLDRKRNLKGIIASEDFFTEEGKDYEEILRGNI